MILSPEIISAIQSGAVAARWLIWVKERWGTGTLGITTFEGDIRIPIDGVNRTYVGAGPILGMPEINYEAGTTIQNHRLTLSILDAKVVNMIRNFNVRLMEVEIRVAFFDAETDALIGTDIAYLGTMDGITIKEGGKTSSCEVVVSSRNRAGTKTLYLRKSHASQSLKRYPEDPTDNGRKYASIAGTVTVAWGQDNESVFRMRTRG